MTTTPVEATLATCRASCSPWQQLKMIFRDAPPVNAISEPGGIIVSYDDNEEPVSIGFLNASKRQLFNPQELQLTIAT